MAKIKLGLVIAGILVALFLLWWLLSFIPVNGKSSNAVQIGIDSSWKPIQFYNREQYVSYFSEDLLSSIAENQNFSKHIIQTESDFLYKGLLDGDFDAILSSVPIPNQYELRDFVFSNIYFPLGPVIVTSKNSRVKSINDISNKKIGFIIGFESGIPFYQNTTIRFVPYDNTDLPRLIDDLLDDNIDGAILPAMHAYHYAERGIYQHQLKIVTPPLNNRGLAFITKNNPQSKKLIKKFNDGLKTLQENGTYNQLLQKWDFAIPKETPAP